MTKRQVEKGVAALYELLLSPEVNARRRSYFKGVMKKLKQGGVTRWQEREPKGELKYGVSVL